MNRPLSRQFDYCRLLHFYPGYTMDELMDLTWHQLDALMGGMNKINEDRANAIK